MFRVIIAGGRDFDDYQLLKATMDKLLCNITDEITVVCGQAKGADTLGEQYAMEKGYTDGGREMELGGNSMKIIVTTPTSQDYKKFCSVGMNAEACLADCVKLICQDDAGHVAESFMKQDEFDRLGLAYIEQHAKLEHSEVCDEWFMKCSQNSWYNNLERNPEKVIKVMFVGIEDGTGREVYRGVETHRYYLREVHANQRFAKWYLCGERRVPEDGREPRPNLIFQLGDQTEKVVYDDWNGVAAYKEQFNKNFRAEG